MKKLYLAWQDSDSREWATVGQLTKEDGLYTFIYTKGSKDYQGFKPFSQMDDLFQRYTSKKLFPIFSNRILAKGRPEYLEYLEWLGMTAHDYDDMEELSLTGGLRATDDLEIFPCPQQTKSGRYEVSFFSRGLQHLQSENVIRAASLNIGERLYLMKDCQNKKDRTALLLRSDDPVNLMGYTPRYLSKDFSSVLDSLGPEKVSITVEKINVDAPLQYRIRCKLESDWPVGFLACSNAMYQPISETAPTLDVLTSPL